MLKFRIAEHLSPQVFPPTSTSGLRRPAIIMSNQAALYINVITMTRFVTEEGRKMVFKQLYSLVLREVWLGLQQLLFRWTKKKPKLLRLVGDWGKQYISNWREVWICVSSPTINQNQYEHLKTEFKQWGNVSFLCYIYSRTILKPDFIPALCLGG